MEYTLTLPIRAIGKERPRFAGHAYTPARTASTEALIAAEWVAAKLPRNLDGALRLYVRATYRVPASRQKGARKVEIGEPYDQTPDCDNVWKLCADALQGVAYESDRRIADAGIAQVWGDRDSLTITLAQMGRADGGDGW